MDISAAYVNGYKTRTRHWKMLWMLFATEEYA